MQIWILGTLEVTDNGRPVVVRGSLPRRLLALLALTPGREVGTDLLIDALWGDSPAAVDALATLHSQLARLRRDLPSADLVRTGHKGLSRHECGLVSGMWGWEPLRPRLG
jgi:DNA-binding SARP family transcriptional activator